MVLLTILPIILPGGGGYYGYNRYGGGLGAALGLAFIGLLLSLIGEFGGISR